MRKTHESKVTDMDDDVWIVFACPSIKNPRPKHISEYRKSSILIPPYYVFDTEQAARNFIENLKR